MKNRLILCRGSKIILGFYSYFQDKYLLGRNESDSGNSFPGQGYLVTAACFLLTVIGTTISLTVSVYSVIP